MRNINYILAAVLALLLIGNYIHNQYYIYNQDKIIEGMNGSRKDQPLYVIGMAAILIYLLLTRESPTLKKMGAYN